MKLWDEEESELETNWAVLALQLIPFPPVDFYRQYVAAQLRARAVLH